MTYNSKLKVLWPSDLKFTLMTLTIILGPAALLYYCVWFADPRVVSIHVKIILTSLFSFFLVVTLITLFRTTFADPGVLPSIYLNSGIENKEKYKAVSAKEYFVEYQSKQEL